MLEQKLDHPVVDLVGVVVYSAQANPLEEKKSVRHLRDAGPPRLQSYEDVEVGFELAFRRVQFFFRAEEESVEEDRGRHDCHVSDDVVHAFTLAELVGCLEEIAVCRRMLATPLGIDCGERDRG